MFGCCLGDRQISEKSVFRGMTDYIKDTDVSLTNPFCYNYYILAIDANAVATLFVVIAIFCPLLQIEWKQIMFVLTGQ